MPSRNNLIIITCKKVCTQILDVIMDLEVDVRVRMICSIFKEVNDAGISPQEFALIEGRIDGEERLAEMEKMRVRPEKVLFWTELWKGRLQEMLSTRDLFDLAYLDGILLELSQYNNAELLNASISIMRRTYDQRNECI